MELLPLEVIANTPKIHPEYRPSCVIQLGLRLSDLHPQPVPPFWSARPLRFFLGTFSCHLGIHFNLLSFVSRDGYASCSRYGDHRIWLPVRAGQVAASKPPHDAATHMQVVGFAQSQVPNHHSHRSLGFHL